MQVFARRIEIQPATCASCCQKADKKLVKLEKECKKLEEKWLHLHTDHQLLVLKHKGLAEDLKKANQRADSFEKNNNVETKKNEGH